MLLVGYEANTRVGMHMQKTNQVHDRRYEHSPYLNLTSRIPIKYYQ